VPLTARLLNRETERPATPGPTRTQRKRSPYSSRGGILDRAVMKRFYPEVAMKIAEGSALTRAAVAAKSLTFLLSPSASI
jgi:hypothetical protein